MLEKELRAIENELSGYLEQDTQATTELLEQDTQATPELLERVKEIQRQLKEAEEWASMKSSADEERVLT